MTSCYQGHCEYNSHHNTSGKCPVLVPLGGRVESWLVREVLQSASFLHNTQYQGLANQISKLLIG